MVDKVKNSIVNKARLLYGIVLLAMIAIVLRVIQLKCGDQEALSQESASIRDVVLDGTRGDIISSDGRILASSSLTYELRWDLKTPYLSENSFFENNVDSLAACMSQLFGDSTAQSYAQSFRTAFKNKKQYYLIKRNVTARQLAKVHKFPIFNKGIYRSGLIEERKYTRMIPHGNLAYRTIGYINDHGAQVGMELAFNDKLSGVKGQRREYKIGGGDWTPMRSYDGNIEPQDGCDIVSTINMEIQDIADKSLRQLLVKSNAKFGTAIVMEVATGDIKAMVNLGYDTVKHIYAENYNYAMGRTLPPGSTFKLASMIAVLEKTNMSIDDSIDVMGTEYPLPGRKEPIKDDHSLAGKHSIRDIFEHSSNVGVAQLVRATFQNDENDFTERLADLGLNKITEVDLKGELLPVFRFPSNKMWWRGSLEMVSIGYETEFTPLQMLTFYNAVANDGKMVKPQILKAVKKHGVTIYKTEPYILNSSICTKETINKAKQLLEGVVQQGTASTVLKNNVCKIAGKTGTAQIFEGVFKGHSASFAGYFPADKPKYSCIVVVNSPSKFSVYGSALAAPVFGEIAAKVYARDREIHSDKNYDIASLPDRKELPTTKYGDRGILDRLYSTFNIPMGNVENAQSLFVSTTNEKGVAVLESISTRKAKVPNVVGMGLRDAMYLLRQKNLDVTVVGRGVVKKQSLPVDKDINGGEKITIELAVN